MSDAEDQNPFSSDLDELGEEGQSLESLFGEEESGDNNASQVQQVQDSHPKVSRDIAMFSKIPVRLTLEVDTVEVMLGDLLDLNPGEVLPLDKSTGDPLDVRVNGQLLARAEVVVVDGRYGLRLTEILEDIQVPGNKG